MNLDFNDVKTVLKDGGVAIMSTGYGEGDNRVSEAIKNAQHSPLLNNNDIFNSKKVLLNISYSAQYKLMMSEMDEVKEFMNRFSRDFETKFGMAIDDKLEQLLIKKQDVTRFLQAIAPLYRGVYMVNTKQDTCRYIYVPSYFKTMLENNHHAFMSSVREYCRELVHPEYHDEFAKLLDYSYIEKQIAAHGSLKMTYQIRDGSRYISKSPWPTGVPQTHMSCCGFFWTKRSRRKQVKHVRNRQSKIRRDYESAASCLPNPSADAHKRPCGAVFTVCGADRVCRCYP